MRTPRAVWEGCAEDSRWIDDPEAVVAEIMREGFDAGRADGLVAAARCIERESDRLPQCWWTIPRALARCVRAMSAHEVEPAAALPEPARETS